MPDAAGVIESFFEHAGIAYRATGPGQWAVQLRGERKLTIPVMITVEGERVSFESFFMRAPQDNTARLFELLLRRNMRAYGIAFGVDADGDVYLVGQRAVRELTEEELDRVIGAFLVEADGLFDAAIAIGFERYLEADMAWRARAAKPE